MLVFLYMLPVVNFIVKGSFAPFYLSLIEVFVCYIISSSWSFSFSSSNKNRVSSRSVTEVVKELDKIVAFNNLLISLKNHPNADQFAPGVGPVSLLGMEPNWAFPLMFITVSQAESWTFQFYELVLIFIFG